MTDDIQSKIEALEEQNVRDEQKKGRGGKQRRPKRDEPKEQRVEGESLVEKLISIRRVTKVVKGGKNMRFSALVIVGDGKGKVGYANSKAREVPDAIKKAVGKAKKRFIKVPMKFGKTVHHDVNYYKGSSRVIIRTAKAGTGVIAGGSMRSMFEAVGIHDVVAKAIGTNNSYNVVRATFNALKMTESPRDVAKRRGLAIQDLNHRRKVLSSKRWIDEVPA
ncbi:MAG: 30S ribosomal protein S5 [Pseudomonadota bacterium]